MNKEEIFSTLEKYNLSKEDCIILSGASLVVQGITESTGDIDIATTTKYYNSLDWQTKIGALGKEIKFKDNIEISNNLYDDKRFVKIGGYKFANLEFVLEVKEMLYRLKDKNIIKQLRKSLYKKSLLRFTGIGNMQNYQLKNTSAFMKFDKTMLLLDCGMTTFFELQKRKVLENLDEIFIAITHSHPDHIGSLAALVLYLKFNTNIKINIIVNEKFREQKTQLGDILLKNGVQKDYFSFIDVKNVNSFFKIDSLRIRHCEQLKSYAYTIIIDDQTKYYYLGDNKDVKVLRKTLNQLRYNDFIFTDISKSPSRVHLEFKELLNIADKSKLNQIFCIHFDSKKSIKLAKQFGLRTAEIE